MAKVIIILLIALTFEAIGVVLLSAGLKQIGEPRAINAREIGRVVRRGVTHPKVLLGVLFETIFFVFLLVLLKRNDVSLIWPLTSLGFVLTALTARWFLHEEVSRLRWVGVALIVVGAGLVSWSERTKTPSADRGTAQPAARLELPPAR